MTALAALTTLGVGGEARELVEARDASALVRLVREAWESGEDWLVLGGGSNLLVSDDGVDGRVVRVLTRGIERLPAAPGRVRVRVEAGEPWDVLVSTAVSAGWSGIEALSGIPGSVGAAPVQNIGAYGAELADTLVAIDFLDYATGEAVRVEADELGFGYRTSAIKRGRAGVVLAVELELAEDPSSAPVAYEQLAAALGVALGDRVPLAHAREAVLRLRAAKGMVLDPTDADAASAGSFFTNPIVSENAARALPADAPRWPLEPDEPDRAVPLGAEPALPPAPRERLVKLSAAWLIERAGIARGFRLPGSRAAVSSKHTLALTNRGGATAAEIAELARFVQSRVLADFGILLQPEPVLVGVNL